MKIIQEKVFYGNMNIIGTHDTERILTVLDGNIEFLKLIVALQFTSARSASYILW